MSSSETTQDHESESNSQPSPGNVGSIGESIAARFLVERGYFIVARNYRRPYAEIDIVCRRDHEIHFVEVKTVSHETRTQLEQAVSHETWRPEEQVHRRKLGQIARGAQVWLAENDFQGPVYIDVCAVRIVSRETYATVELIENITIE